MRAIPSTPDQIDRDWLQEALARQFPEARIRQVEVLKAHSGTTGRARIGIEWDSKSPELPTTLFAKMPPVDDAQKDLVVEWGMGRREALFYKHLSAEVPVRVPHSYYSDASEDGLGYIMLIGDLRAICGRPAAVLRDSTLELAQQLMEEFGKLHATYWDSPRFASNLAWLKPFPLVRNVESARLIAVAHKEFASEMPPEFVDACCLMRDHQEAVASLFEQGTPTLIHGDAHIGNLYFDADGRVGFFDWALCARMPGMWDVAYVLTNSFPPEVRQPNEEALLRIYIESLAKHGGPERGFAEIWDEYRLYAYYSWISTTLTAGAGSRMQSLEVGLRGSRWTTEALTNLGSLELIRNKLGLSDS
jgi:hypothetical protein